MRNLTLSLTFLALLCSELRFAQEGDDHKLPVIVVTKDDTVIKRSCRVRIPEGLVITDKNDNGVLLIQGSGIRIVFTKDSVLRGAEPAMPHDQLRGLGIRIDGKSSVTIEDARVQGYKVGLHASGADALRIIGCTFTNNFRQKLRSTPLAEDSSDWLYPHDNDDKQWMKRYGAAIYIEKSTRVTVHDVKVRRGQNGIILDRVQDSSIFDNDCSFLSGWGLALWRSNGNRITRNALDFCIRGYSHAVYNRGQDSAGLLMFEQCSNNLIAENSITHGGDGIFGHAGKEALGQGKTQAKAAFYQRRGNNDNLIIANDLSYAAAHGLEMTFCFGNRIYENRIVGNAICGIWGGYSQDSSIGHNEFSRNGEFGYGLERGGINIEHGADNLIHHNHFHRNNCGVHLWDDDDPALLKLPWAKANHRGCVDNRILFNHFDGDLLALHLRAAKRTIFSQNELLRVKRAVNATKGSEPLEDNDNTASQDLPPPSYRALGRSKPVGARKALRGREKIIMDEWGPWDHESPMLRFKGEIDGAHRYEYFGLTNPPKAKLTGTVDRSLRLVQGKGHVDVRSRKAGVHPYELQIEARSLSRRIKGQLLSLRWQVAVFPWTVDPRKDLDGWYAEAKKSSLHAETSSLQFKYGNGGPKDLQLSPQISKSEELTGDHFGTIARTRLSLPRGKWRVVTRSDDGIRVTVAGKRIIDNWTHHGPTTDRGEFTVKNSKPIEILVEHFEIDGYAWLSFDLQWVGL